MRQASIIRNVIQSLYLLPSNGDRFTAGPKYYNGDYSVNTFMNMGDDE